MTENSAVATLNYWGRNKVGTVGEPVKGIGFRIDPDTGEIQTKHDGVFLGYWNKPEATAAAKAALALANKQKPPSTGDFKGVPATILKPIAVIKTNVKDTVVKDGIYKVEQICAGSFAKACSAAGLS